MKVGRLVSGTSLAALALSVTACGKSGVDSTPTPTPTPTPTTSPDYLTMAEVDATGGDKLFHTAGVKNEAATFSSSTFGNDLVLEYIASSNTYKVTRAAATSGGTATTVSFDASAGVVQSDPRITKYTATAGDVLYLVKPQVGGVDLTYTRFLGYTNSGGTAGNLGVYGVPTLASDVPLTGTATYTVAVDGTASQGGKSYILTGHASGTFSADFATDKITNSLVLSGAEVGPSTVTDLGTLSGTGTISGSTFGGTLAGSGTNAPAGSGAFSGIFFGPAAAELGYGWYFDGTSLDASGQVVGKKD